MEQRFHELKVQKEAGEIGDEQFAAEVKKLQFWDEQGRLWRISSTGQWYYEEGGRWVRGEPPRKKVLPKATAVVLLLAVGVFMLIVAGIWAGREVILGFVTPPTDTPCPTAKFTGEPTVEPTVELTLEPTEEPTEEPTAELTSEPTEEPTEEPTAEPTSEPTEEPTEEPTAEPTSEPTEEPTEGPTVEPTEESMAGPTKEPTKKPTPKPTNTPTPSVTGKIAFPVFDPQRRTYDIFIANTDGTGRKKIKEEASQPCLNPEGTWIAYRSWRSDKRGLRVADTLGHYLWTITTDFEASRPSVSKGGIAYHRRQSPDRPVHIYLFPGSEKSKVIRYEDQHQPLPGESPAWVSGERLVFKSCIRAASGLYLAESVYDGTDITRVTYDTSDTNPEASPDGKKIAFMSRRDGNWEIYVMDLDGGTVKRLTTNAANDGLPIWSPDGRIIAFASNRSGEWAIWAMNPDGSNLQMLFPLGGSLHGYVWNAPLNERGGWEEERLSWSP
jgi:hypothetical protein